jgi:hypothetical protein
MFKSRTDLLWLVIFIILALVCSIAVLYVCTDQFTDWRTM